LLGGDALYRILVTKWVGGSAIHTRIFRFLQVVHATSERRRYFG
jgi:hypothetical protein